MIIPSIDLINGKIVRLYQGKYNLKTFYEDHIYSVLSDYFLQGASIVHLVDLDGALNPHNKQTHVIKSLLNHSNFNLQVGGGIRNHKDIELLLSLGVKRVVIGSSAIYTPKKINIWLQEYGNDSIVLALDLKISRDNFKEVVVNAWKSPSGISLEELIHQFSPLGLKHVLCTDVSKDGTLLGPNVDLYKYLSDSFNHIHFQSSGGIGSLNDIMSIRRSGVKNIIIGRALLEKKFSLIEAIKCWQNG
ncbi:MAG: 1-(5-phosphoribosyl)-5-[(5-phosphoribosylamino)methylideneamino]imidazole-4-carboxamide isomerase [Buchnera aphidicola (Kaburagia rhusicola rhusicola)]